MESRKANLARAKKAKNDEFYTRLSDIEKELQHYKDHFKGKTVYCNCDDPFESNFFKYFALSFNHLGLKKLIATSYKGSELHGTNKLADVAKKPHVAMITEIKDKTDNNSITIEDVFESFGNGANQLVTLDGDGDFRSKESIEFLKESDIVVTNPPFSLFGEYVTQLIEHEKRFLVIGNMNAIAYKEIFPLIKDNRLWLGNNMVREFKVANVGILTDHQYTTDTGERFQKFGNVLWFTNMDYMKRHEDITLVKTYEPVKYPTYDNYDAIEVNKVVNIPHDYAGIMGVPITFLGKHNPNQFEIVGIACGNSWINYPQTLEELGFNPNMKYGGGLGAGLVNGKPKYARILIRNKHPVKPANTTKQERTTQT